jgi:uncharacterized protein (DUF433 family)
MKPEEYFTFETIETQFGPVERIRIKGHRISIEHVIERYQNGKTAKNIVERDFPTLSLDEVNAAIAYYETNKVAVDEYIRRGEEVAEAFYQEHLRGRPSAVGQRLRELRSKQLEANVKANDKMPPPV